MDTDASGHIHYTSLFRHIEAAEHEFLRSFGRPYLQLENGQFGYPRVHVECDYRAPLVYDDPISIEVSVAAVGRSSWTFQFHLRTGDRLAANSKITIVCVDLATGRPHAMPDSLRQFLEGHLSGGL